MPQISKAIPIKSYAGFPSIIKLQEYALLEGNAYIASSAEEVEPDATTRYFWRITENKAYAFRIDIALAAATATFEPPSIFLREMTAALTPSVWSGYPMNLNRLYSSVASFEVGTHATANTPTEMQYLTPGEGWVSKGEWFVANPDKTYGIKVINNDSVNSIWLNFWVYFITGVN